jgi:uncharacterized protein
VTFVLLAIGLVLIVEGLAYALAPSFIEKALRALVAMRPDQRRIVGLGMAVLGAMILSALRVSGAI